MEQPDDTLQQLMFSLIEVWKTSGKTQLEFCKEKDSADHKFHYWFRKYSPKPMARLVKTFLLVGEPKRHHFKVKNHLFKV